MKIKLTLNNKAIDIECSEEETLFSVLRNQNIKSIKYGDKKGLCEACSVLLNNKQVPASIVPIASVQNQTIITLEGFALSEEYEDIVQGLQRAQISLCGYCNTGKIFAIHDLISSENYPNRNDIITKMKNFTCACTTIETIIDAIYKAYDVRYERIGKNKYGRK